LRSANAQADLLGSIVAERYHILKKLGEGGMGTVYLAEHVKMGRKAALKVMNPGMNSDPDAIARFNREAANASRLNHPNVCGIYDFGETPDGLIYLAMEFIEGESLTSLIEKNGHLAAPRAASIIHQAADALAVAHDYGIVHRDLKPDNIMIAKARDGGDMVKVVDFGIAKASSSDAQKVTKTGLVVGTPEYMSPEQLAGDKLDGRSDIYSLGLVAFNCLTGLLPFPSNSAQEAMIMRLTDEPKTLAEMKPDIQWPAALQKVMDKVLMRDAELRYQKSSDFGRDIAKAVENMPAAVAAAEGTMVMGAAPAEVPKTRMSAKSEATMKLSAATAGAATVSVPAPSPASTPAKKSPVMMIVAAVVVIAGIGGAAVFMKSGASASPPKSADTASKQAAQTANTPAATPIDDKSAATPNMAPPGGSSTAPGGGSKQTEPVKPLSGGLAKGPVANDPPPPAAAANASATIAKWDKTLSATDRAPTETDAKSALAALQPLMEKLKEPDRSNGMYVEMLAYMLLDTDDAQVCRTSKEVIANDPNTNHVKTASYAQTGRKCQ
jgi:serine/threonine-protein kinase